MNKLSKICKRNWRLLKEVTRMDQCSSISQYLVTLTLEDKLSQSVTCSPMQMSMLMKSFILRKTLEVTCHKCHSSRIRKEWCMRIPWRFWNSWLKHTSQNWCHRMRIKISRWKWSSTTCKPSTLSWPTTAMVKSRNQLLVMASTKSCRQSSLSLRMETNLSSLATVPLTLTSTCTNALSCSTSWHRVKCGAIMPSCTTTHLRWPLFCNHSGIRITHPSAIHSSTDSPKSTTGQMSTSRIDETSE